MSFTYFKTPIESYELPDKFTFPFYYEPHPLAVIAAKELQEYLQNQTDFEHNFGFEGKEGLGKMFGVLVVKDKHGKLGYLAAFSGKLADSNHHQRFVPPVADILKKDGIFKKGETELNRINDDIETLENAKALKALQKKLRQQQIISEQEIAATKQKNKAAKLLRKQKRQTAQQELSTPHFLIFNETLRKESIRNSFMLKHLIRDWKQKIEIIKAEIQQHLDKINILKDERKQKSSNLQQQIFKQYQFFNQYGEKQDLNDIFKDTIPMAGAGECAAPKLLQYAFKHDLQPIVMAEFWWGKSPNSAVRQHQNYYPACQSRCKPILNFMLKGLPIDDNPMLKNLAINSKIETVYEDDYLLIINKPTELLSVPGKTISDSVLLRMQLKYPEATGPMIVHRLDMSTSGLLVIAKQKAIHKTLQRQFIKRQVKKRYVAVLDGEIQEEAGYIDLPLRVDLDDRPRQLVCYEHGKTAQTKWEVIERKNGKTRVYFYPITGRTHQLRVHAAHSKGLNSPIVGDDLYGKKETRLHLHAERLEFTHPISSEKMVIEKSADF